MELLRGWLLHAHKGRDRHDEAALRLDRYRYWLGVPATVLVAVAGTSAITAWQGSADKTLGLVAGLIAIGAAVLVGLQTFLDYGSRAERHRMTAVNYKKIIREIEQHRVPALQSPCRESDEAAMRGVRTVGATGDSEEGAERSLDDWLEDVRKRLDRLEEEAPVVPLRIYRLIEARYRNATFVAQACKLVEGSEAR